MKLLIASDHCNALVEYALGVVLMFGLAGCGSQPDAANSATVTSASAKGGSAATPAASNSATASDAEMRKSFQQKTWDINSVPEKDRERVRAIMEAQKNRTK